MFERFTASARDLVVRAVQEATTTGASRVTDVHVLLALLDLDDPILTSVFSQLAISPDAVSRRVHEFDRSVPGRAGLSPGDVAALESLGIDAESILEHAEGELGSRQAGSDQQPVGAHEPSQRRGHGRRRSRGRPRFASSAKRTLEGALRQAIDMRHAEISAEHVLLGLLLTGGAAAEYLGREGVELAGVRAAVRHARSAAAPGSSA